MRPGTEIFSDADGRSTERESREHIVRHTVPNGGSGDWEGPAADGRQFHGRGTSSDLSEKSGANVDQADWRHEPVDSGMTAQFHEWPCRPT